METWLLEYGIYAIFLLLALGIIGLPIPDETIIALAGVLVAKGKLSLIPTLIAVYGGGLTGITLSYLLGYTYGHYLIRRFGYLLGITPDKINKAERWFKEIGKWMLFFGYFIVGLRHLAGFVAGIMKLSYKQFALFAYPGVLFWGSGIFTIGYTFGRNYGQHLNMLSYISIAFALIALTLIYSFFSYKKRKSDSTNK